MFVDEIVRIANSYFAMSEEEARVALSKSSLDENYLSAILTSVEPFFKRYLTQTSVELRRKIGRVAFEKLNNANFLQESVTQLKIRLTEFFNLTSDYGINPYEIFYASVIASAHNFITVKEISVATSKKLATSPLFRARLKSNLG